MVTLIFTHINSAWEQDRQPNPWRLKKIYSAMSKFNISNLEALHSVSRTMVSTSSVSSRGYLHLSPIFQGPDFMFWGPMGSQNTEIYISNNKLGL
jgi:hypothetical protein